MRNIFAKLRSLPRRSTAIVAMLTMVIAVPAALNAWGPQRDTYTIEKPADHVVFNSITNNPNVGDERNFVGIREAGSDNGLNNVWYDDMEVQEGKEYYVRMYVHNNAAANLGLVAENVTAKFNLPTTTAKSIQVNGFLSASNIGANTTGSNGAYGEVYDHATFTSDSNFNLAYVEGSLKYENNVFGSDGVALPESIFTSTGAALGYDKLDGKIPGCFQYAGYVTFKVKPQIEKTLDFELVKKVSKNGANEWNETYKAQPGEVVDFMLAYKNTGEAQQNSVTFRDTLPAGLTYVDGSAKWSNASKQNVAISGNNLVNGTGVNIGSYATGANAWITFSAKVADNDSLTTCGANSLKNVAKVTTEGYSVEDDATVTVDKECETENPTPEYRCDLLEVNRFDANGVAFNVKWSQSDGVTKKSHVVRVYDAEGKEVYNTIDNKFEQLAAGKYTIKAFVTFTVDGQDEEVTSTACTAERTIEEEEEEKPAIKIEKLVNGAEHTPVDLNEEFNYQIKVTNTGNVELKDAIVTDKQPTGVTFVSASEGKIDNGTWTTTISSLKVGESKSFTIKAKITDYIEGKIKNTACVDTPTIPGDNDGCDDATVEVPPTPEAGEETVCELETSEIITIDEGDFDSSKHSKDLDDCSVVPETTETTETETPSELPQTGANDVMIGGLGLGALATTTIAYVASRRRIIGQRLTALHTF